MSGDELDYQLISSLRYDREALLSAHWNTSRNGDRQSPYLLLSYTVDRFATAAKTHSWATPPEFDLHWLERRCDASLKGKDPSQPYKIRIVHSKRGEFSIESAPVPKLSKPEDLFIAATSNPTSSSPLLGPLISVYPDTEPTSPSIFTSTKTTNRKVYNLARARVSIPAVGVEPGTPKDVILYRPGGQVMETSIRNIAFWREGRWVTPPLRVGCLPGVARRMLIEDGKIVEGEVFTVDLKVGEILLLFNAVEGARLGELCTLS
ncbi:aminotransferase [Thelephora terrestris]|uniref:Aminotransferase n=1 Tax=Thelephora terrestris TaxID=56493 RepID=A0A9P6L7H2_9AGAM|nr:aminotransferase [Thelephora terrestris]